MDYKLIVTHESPDLDAVGSVWILKRFDKEHFENLPVDFVHAGDKISEGKLAGWGIFPNEAVHVDTGLGELDHHSEEQANQPLCAASLVRDFVIHLHPEISDDEALKRMVDHFVEIDHFGECYWPDANNGKYLFQLHDILHHLKTVGAKDEEVVEFGMKALDAVYSGFKIRVSAEEEMKKALVFETKWGRAAAVLTNNDEVVKYAQKEGYMLAIRKDPDEGNVRIKAVPGKQIDLTPVYEKIHQRDPEANWYLHPGKTMLLNGSRKHRGQKSSKLSLEEVIQIIKELA